MLRRLTLAFCIATALSACQHETLFRQADSQGRNGYNVVQIEENRFRLSFDGNEVTSRDAVSRNLAYLAAKVTLEHGYDYYVINRQNEETYPTYGTTSVPTDYGVPRAEDEHSGSYWDNTEVLVVVAYRNAARAEMQTFKGTKPADDPSAYDAHDVAARLAPLVPVVLRK